MFPTVDRCTFSKDVDKTLTVSQVLPKALALPFWLVSRRLGLPPILTYADSVLANWKLKDPTR